MGGFTTSSTAPITWGCSGCDHTIHPGHAPILLLHNNSSLPLLHSEEWGLAAFAI